MHEHSLFGLAPKARCDQIRHVLSGITAMQPQPVHERHAIYRPTHGRPVQPAAQVGGSQGIRNAQKQALQAQLMKDLHFLQLVQSLEAEDFGAGKSVSLAAETREEEDDDDEGSLGRVGRENGVDVVVGIEEEKSFVVRPWVLQFYDTPEPGKRSTLTRMISSTEMVAGDVHKYMESIRYSFVSEYFIVGDRFVHNNVVIVLHQMLQIPPSQRSSDLPAQNLPALQSMSTVDSSASILHAYVRVQDAGKPDVMKRAANELDQFRELMKGVVELDVPDRLALDTRIK